METARRADAPPSCATTQQYAGRERMRWGVSDEQSRLRPSAPRSAPHHDRVRDDHQDRSADDRNEPTGPVDPGAAVAAEQNVDVPADDHTTDAAQNGEPNRDVVPG